MTKGNTENIFKKDELILNFIISLILEYYLKNEIDYSKVLKCPQMEEYLTKFDKIYCFNYTKTLEQVYGITEEKIVYIHGKLGSGYGNIILGCDDENPKSISQAIRSDYNNIEKNTFVNSMDKASMNVIKYDNSDQANLHSEEYEKNILELEEHLQYINVLYPQSIVNEMRGKNKKTEVEIFGHSLGKSDKRFVNLITKSLELQGTAKLKRAGNQPISLTRNKKNPRIKVSYYTSTKKRGKMPKNLQQYLEEKLEIRHVECRKILVSIDEILS